MSSLTLFFAWAQHPEIAASQALYQPYGPTNLKSGPFLADPKFDTHRPYLPHRRGQPPLRHPHG